MAVGRERGSRNDAALHQRQARVARAARRSPARPASAARASKNGTRSSSSAASPVAIRYCASTTSGQNTMSPCESPARMARSRSKNMNHCGQSPSGFCMAITRSSRSRTAADAPAPAAARPGPGRHRVFPSRRPSTAPARAATGNAPARSARTRARTRPGAPRSRPAGSRPAPRSRSAGSSSRAVATASGGGRLARRSARRCNAVLPSASDAGHEAQVRLSARASILEQQLIAADPLELRARNASGFESALGKAAPDLGSGTACSSTASPWRRHCTAPALLPSSPLSAT